MFSICYYIENEMVNKECKSVLVYLLVGVLGLLSLLFSLVSELC